jgi:hypothetical protein
MPTIFLGLLFWFSAITLPYVTAPNTKITWC